MKRLRRKRITSGALVNNPPLLLRVILEGTFWVTVAVFVASFVNHISVYTNLSFMRLWLCFLGFILLLVIGVIMLVGRHLLASWLLLVFYASLAFLVLIVWGFQAQVGLLGLAFVVVLAGMLIGSGSIVPVASCIVVMLIALQLFGCVGMMQTDRTLVDISMMDLLSYIAVFSIFALTSWLSRRQMEQTLYQAQEAEKALLQEKELLAVRLEEQTRHLRAVQLEEMRQLYRFAELGQMSTAVLHELANYLTVLMFDIDDIHQQHPSEEINRARESLTYMESMVQQVRDRIRDDNKPYRFKTNKVLNEARDTLVSRATKQGVTLIFKLKGSPSSVGDPLRLLQAMTVLIINAIDAYNHQTVDVLLKQVIVESYSRNAYLYITVTDFGVGIKAEQRKGLFTPIRSNKTGGMGIGLYIASEMIKTNFQGTLELDPRLDMTRFIIRLPLPGTNNSLSAKIETDT